MRLQFVATSPVLLYIIQILISTWFLLDFIISRDSFNVTPLTTSTKSHHAEHDRLSNLIDQVGQKHCQNSLSYEKKTFDNVILVVIDALGADFIPTLERRDSNIAIKMPFLEEALRSGKAMGFVAKASTPTVTMPRIKALVSGTIPSFMDIITNLATDVSKFDADNLIDLNIKQNRSVVLYGDDTWLALFQRDKFKRVNETFSLFASDYTSVDTNVTYNAIPETLRQNIDWDLMILHYLGLDHIGHSFGSNKVSLIDKKLLEMDEVLEIIYKNMSNRKDVNGLIVVCGDHGMSSEGNHGGDSELESRTALIAIPTHRDFAPFKQKNTITIQQVDLAVTIALLTGLSIPRSSIGVPIEPLLQASWTGDQERVACSTLRTLGSLIAVARPANLAPLYKSIEQSLRSHLDSSEDHKHFGDSYINLSKLLQVEIQSDFGLKRHPILLTVALLIVAIASLLMIKRSCMRLYIATASLKERLTYTTILFLPMIMPGSTDFIESEHNWWTPYSVLCLLMMIAFSSPVHIRNSRSTARKLTTVVCLACVCHGWAYARHMLGGPLAAGVAIFSLLILCNSIRLNTNLKQSAQFIVPILIATTIVLVRFTEDVLNIETRSTSIIELLGAVLMSICVVYIVLSSSGRASSIICNISHGWLCATFLLVRGNQFGYLIANKILESNLNGLIRNTGGGPYWRPLIYVALSQAAYYNQGNRNIFSALDVKPAFFAQSTYNVYLAVPLVIVATFASQIFWYLKLFQRTESDLDDAALELAGSVKNKHSVDDTKNRLALTCNFVITRNHLSLTYYMLVCLVLRNHLFVWSVITPKLVYHYVTNCVLTTITLLVLTIASTANKYSLSA